MEGLQFVIELVCNIFYYFNEHAERLIGFNKERLFFYDTKILGQCKDERLQLYKWLYTFLKVDLVIIYFASTAMVLKCTAHNGMIAFVA